MDTHCKYMELAMTEAGASVIGGSLPFACVVVNEGGEVVWRDRDRVEERCDPTAHAEINAVRGLCQQLQVRDLSDYTFYTTSEPCPTCFSALIKAKVRKVYFGAPTESDASLPVSAQELAGRSNRTIEVFGGILEVECLQQRNNYFKILNKFYQHYLQ